MISPGQTGVSSDFVGIKMFKGYAADAGSTDSYVISVLPVPTSYVTGDTYIFKANTINTGACTLNVNSLGAKTIKKIGTTDLSDGDIKAGQIVIVVYDGTNFTMLNESKRGFASGATTQAISSTTTLTIPHGLAGIPRLVKLTGIYANSTLTTTVIALVQNGTVSGISQLATGLGTSTSFLSNNAVNFAFWSDFSSSNQLFGTPIADATNITVTWSKAGTPTGTISIIWEAYL